MNFKKHCQKICASLAVAISANGLWAEIIKTDGSDIGITIMGTIVQKNTDDNVALIKVQSGTVSAIKKGYKITNQFDVIAIHDHYLELTSNQGKQYWVYRDKFAIDHEKQPSISAQTNTDGKYSEDGFERKEGNVRMTSLYRDKLVKDDLSKILMQATAEPYFENGQIAGFTLTQIDVGSIYQKAGLHDGDIITKINDQELTSVANSIRLLQSLKNIAKIEIDVKRGDQRLHFNIEID